MTEKLDIALNRLNKILPLKDNQLALSAQHRQLHQALLQSFAQHGQVLSKQQIVELAHDSEAALSALSDAKLIVINDSMDILGAYPFTTQTREHVVHVNSNQVHAMCALDALSVAPMFDAQTHITSLCRVTKATISVQQNKSSIVSGNHHYFGIIWSAASTTISCSDSLCMDMIFLKDSTVAKQWLNEAADSREIFNLEDAVKFGSLFFNPLVG